MCLVRHCRLNCVAGSSNAAKVNGGYPMKRNRSARGPLTDDEVVTRMAMLSGIIAHEGDKEVEALDNQAEEGNAELVRELVSSSKNVVDEWIEMLRADTEMNTRITCAKLRRAAKLNILEAFWKMTEGIKDEAKERIKKKWQENSQESGQALELMLLQGALKLLESTILVHMTKQDMKKVERHYSSVSQKYEAQVEIKIRIITSTHYLKEHHIGRLVVTNKKSTIFVDMNLQKSVEKVADDVISNYFSKSGFFKGLKPQVSRFTVEQGLKVMPRAKNITSSRLEVLLSDLRKKDPRNHPPVFHIKEDVKKLVVISPPRSSPPKEQKSPGFEALERSRISLSQVEHPPLYKYRQHGKKHSRSASSSINRLSSASSDASPERDAEEEKRLSSPPGKPFKDEESNKRK